MASAVYDDIALDYKTSKELPFRTYIETYSLFRMTGPVDGLDILDLACGEGFYTRKLKKAGAQFVGGVDISSEMVLLAERNEEEMPIGCKYSVHNVATMPTLGSFDLVVAMYLLNYARTQKELLAFCRAAFRQLKSGGRFIGVNDNPANDPAYYKTYRPYGFIKDCYPDRKEGDPILYTFYQPDNSFFQFNNFYLHPKTYEEAFKKAGFINFRWIPVTLDPTQANNQFWARFMTQPPIVGFSAERG
jgi:SAM-dependent methyltransferase